MGARSASVANSTARIAHGGDTVDRDQRARLNVAVIALDRPDSEEFLADVLDALGLRKPTARPRPVKCGPAAEAVRDECGTEVGYIVHGRRHERSCESCKQAHNEHIADQLEES